MSDTPRTDAFADEHTRDDHLWFAQQCEEFARTLERELAAIKAAEMPEKATVWAGMGAGPHVNKEDYDALRAFALRKSAEAEHWKDYAQHQEQCSECAESVGYCETGSALRDAAIDKERT